jgi:hypothetical protein
MGIQAVRDVLVAAGAVTALVPADRIEALRRTQSFAVPAITLQRVSVVPQSHLRSSAGLDSNLVQLDVWDSQYTRARSIADACRASLEALPAGFIMTLETEGFEAETDAELYRISQTWSVFTS